MATKTLSLNLIIDEFSNRVIFAEAGKEFVDVLLSFLTLPLGTLVRLSNKNSITCLDNLYKSVEGLPDEYFVTGTCREMLLSPSHAAEIECLDLLVNVEGNRALSYYICSKDCFYERLSSYENTQCSCRSKMSRKVEVARSSRKVNNEGVFLKGFTRFIITDNFMVVPSSTQTVMNLLGCNRTSASTVVEKQINVGLSEIISILHQSLISKNALTNVFLVRENDNLPEKENSTFSLVAPPKVCSGPWWLDIVGIKLIVDKRKNKVVYAECKQDFIDILFSFLAYPSGFVIKKLNGMSHIACFDNLFGSVVSKPMADCFKTLESKEHLVNPKIPSHFRSSKFLIKSNEAKPMKYYMCRTPGCDCNEVSLVANVQCKCNRITNKRLKIMDPNSSTGGFVSDATYIVTDDLVITPLDSISTLMSKITGEDLVEVPVHASEKEVLALLEAALVGSQAVLTDAFFSKEEITKNDTSSIDDDSVLV